MPAPSPSPDSGPGTGLIAESSLEASVDAAIAETPGAVEPEHEAKQLGLGFWIPVAFLLLISLAAALAPWLPFVDDPNTSTADIEEGPGAEHWMGTDNIGRDVFARVIWGGRVSLAIGVSAIVLGFLVGGALGLTAGYFGRRYEKVVMASMDIMLAFPALVLAMALIRFLSPPGELNVNFPLITTVLTILAVPALARITRASTLTFAQREFVTAARSLGARDIRILSREILPNVLPPMASFALLAIAIVIVAEGSLSFLGLSVKAPTATWGGLINGGRDSLNDAPWISLMPCGVMFLTLLSFNLAGDRLREYFDVKEISL